jgi:hypothetical protein
MFAKGESVTTIGNNPFIQAASTPQTGGAGSARLAAQKAFFEAALGRSSALAAPVQVAEPVAAPVRQDFRASPQAMAEATPQRILRPGSLLNIVV